MNMLFVLALIVAVVAADVGNGLKAVPGGISAGYRNDLRQVGVNYAAEAAGASSGTARYNGVPGSGGFYGYRYGGYPGHYYGGYPGYYDNGYPYHGRYY